MHLSQGILTARGGMTSHAAVVARGMGRAAVVGCGTLRINEENKTLTVDGKVYREGADVSIDGSTGNVYSEAIPTVEAQVSGDFARLMAWADKARTLKVRTNADTPADTKQAVKFGAEGIGLCRTEHMFFEADRIAAVREMILADTVEQREAALVKLLPMQQGDFEGMYTALEGRPMTVRYLDPPLHEFLPNESMTAEIAAIAKELGTTAEAIIEKIDALHEFNPMMGHRGCRLDVSYPEIGRMQTRAIIEAALKAQKDSGKKITPEIMIPLTLDVKEFDFVKKIITDTADEVIAASGQKLVYHVGTMIEIPRAALLASEIAKNAAFFSFGTNDLTQMTYGFSRDDAGKFLNDYYAKKIFEQDPFRTVDQRGVGQLIKMSVANGRKANPDLHIGVCGEHGGDPVSIEFFHNAGLDYVSCSPFRVPVARLAAAQAAIKAKSAKK
jgi:pyruvate,orthophosphate dikinase